MRLTADQVRSYEEDGLLFIPNHFSAREVEIMRAEVQGLLNVDAPGRVLEKDSSTVRAVHGCHADNEVFRTLTALPRLLEPAQNILQSDVYTYQFKINLKAAFKGDVWPWHQDFVFWREEDGMRQPRILNAAVFLDETTEFNGPMYFIPGSHKWGVLDADPRVNTADWVASFSANLKYTLEAETVAALVGKRGMVSPKGPAGSVVFFHGNLAHGSPPNISPYDRTLVVVTYNSVENIPVPRKERRPDFLVSQDCTPLRAVSDDALLQLHQVVSSRAGA